MFTGLIEEVGAVLRRSGADLAIMAEVVLADLKPGDSIAINGACLTVTAINPRDFVVQTSPETLARTTLARLRPGDAVNLERAIQAGARFGGHFVLGHVDGVGRVEGMKDQGKFSLWRFQAPPEVACYLVPKGSVAVDGISLTVVDPDKGAFAAAVIPETLRNTVLGSRHVGDLVNIEADVLGKHIYHYMKGNGGGPDMTMDFLARHGYL